LSETENKIIANKKQYDKELSVNSQIIEKLNTKIHNYEKLFASGNGMRKEESKENINLNTVKSIYI
jgi:glutaredoxin 2